MGTDSLKQQQQQQIKRIRGEMKPYLPYIKKETKDIANLINSSERQILSKSREE